MKGNQIARVGFVIAFLVATSGSIYGIYTNNAIAVTWCCFLSILTALMFAADYIVDEIKKVIKK